MNFLTNAADENPYLYIVYTIVLSLAVAVPIFMCCPADTTPFATEDDNDDKGGNDDKGDKGDKDEVAEAMQDATDGGAAAGDGAVGKGVRRWMPTPFSRALCC